MLDFKQGLSVFKIDSFILGLIIKSNSIEYLIHEDLPIRTKGSGCF